MPFYYGFKENFRQAFCNGGKCKEWELLEPNDLLEE